MNRPSLLTALAVLALLTGCASTRESKPLADALRQGVHLEKSLPKLLPEKSYKVPHSQYVLIPSENAAGLITPVPFVADIVTDMTQSHKAQAYEERYGRVDPYRIVAAAMQGSPALAAGKGGLPMQPFAIAQECVDDRYRVALVAHLEGDGVLGRYLVHLRETYSPQEFKEPTPAMLDRLQADLQKGAVLLRQLVERGARRQLEPSGVRANVRSLHLIGGRASGFLPTNLIPAKDANVVEDAGDHVIVRIDGDPSKAATAGGLFFGVHYLWKDQLDVYEKRAPPAAN